MGLSSSQARLLSLTGRMHDIEYKAQRLEAQKLQMANESAHVYQEYENALNATKIQFRQMSADGSSTFVDATYNAMKNAGYTLKFEDDYKPIISQATKDNYDAAGVNKDYFIALENGRVTTSNRTVDGVTEIYTAAQLQSMSTTGTYRLMSDINLSGVNWTPKSFSGTLDGNGHSITGLKAALFNSISGGTVENLSIQGETNTSRGLLANTINSGSTIQNVAVVGSIDSTYNRVGGLAGTVTGDNILIQNCSSNVSLSTTGSGAGGLLGYVDATNTSITGCSSSGNITAYSEAGGLIGVLKGSNTNITDSISSASVLGTKCANSQFGNDTIVGGFVGNMSGSTSINNCEATGDVKAKASIAGGFVGAIAGDSLIQNSTARGDVTGNIDSEVTDYDGDGKISVHTAGFAGAVSAKIENCDAYGNVSNGTDGEAPPCSFATRNMSGLDSVGEITNCYAATTSDDTPFVQENNEFVSDPTVAATPNNQPLIVTPPNIQVNETVEDKVGAGKTYDEIKKYGYILQGTNNDPLGNNGDNSTWFTNMVNAGLLFIFKTDKDGNEFQVNVATDTNLQEVSSDIALKKAEAKYEADMRKINNKDKKFDTDLAALEQERNAIKTEMDTLKTVAKDNVDRTFKLFS